MTENTQVQTELETQINPDGVSDAPLGGDNADDDGMGAVWDKLMTTNGAEHGADGKFASPNGKGKGAAEAPNAATDPAAKQTPNANAKAEAGGDDPATDAGAEVTGDGEGGEAAQPDDGPIVAPAHLPQSTKAIWGKLPREGQAEIARLTNEWDRKFGALGKQFESVKPIADRLTEATQKLPDFQGMTPEQLAQGAIELGAVQQSLARNPVPTILEIAKHYKVLPQLAAVFTGADGEQSQGRLVAGIQQQLADMGAKLSKSTDPNALREMVSSYLVEKDAEQALIAFGADPANEFFAEVEADLPYFIDKVVEKQQGQPMPFADVLVAAYDMAINANPELRVKVKSAEAKATAGNPDPKRSADARRAASINVKSQTSGKERQPTEEEAMAAAYDRAMAS